MRTAYEQVNPTADWDPALHEDDGGTISELLLSQKMYQTLNEYDPHKMRKEQYILRLREDERKESELAEQSDEGTIDGDVVLHGRDKTESERLLFRAGARSEAPKKPKMAQIERDRQEFERLFNTKKEAAQHFASMSMGNAMEQQVFINTFYILNTDSRCHDVEVL